MRKPGTSFEYNGITLHVVHQPLTGGISCTGCYANNDHTDNDTCKSLRGADDTDELRLCGTRDEGVVFVENIEAFTTALVAFKLSQ